MARTVVTGAGSGIGAAVRARQEAAGDEVVGIDLKNSEIIADLSTPDGRAAAIEGVTRRWPDGIDRLVTCAGLGSSASPPSLIASVNYFGSVEILDGLRPLLEKGTLPAAVSIVSNSAQMAPIEESPFVLALLEHDEAKACRIIDEMESPIVAYMGSKHALGRAIRRRVRTWGDLRVRLNGICPGPVNTPLLARDAANPATRKVIESIDLPIGRRGEPEDVAKLVAFLLSDDAAWIHGSIIFADGGNDAEIRPDRY